MEDVWCCLGAPGPSRTASRCCRCCSPKPESSPSMPVQWLHPSWVCQCKRDMRRKDTAMSYTHTEYQAHIQPSQFLLESIALACFLAPRRAALHSPAPVWQRLGKVGKSRHTAAKRQKMRGTRLGWGRISPSCLPPLRKQTRQLTALSSLLHSPLSKALARHPPVPPLLCRAHAASAGPSCPLSRRSLTSSALSLFIFFFFPFEHISLMESKRHFSDSGVSHCPIPASSTLNAESFSRPIWN